MEKGDKLCILRDGSADPLASDITRLMAALVALGIPLDPECGYLETRELREGKEERIVTWALKARSDCGRYDTRKLIAAWSDEQWLRANPEHALAYLKCGFGNLLRIETEIQTRAPLALIRKGKRIALIPFDASPERREHLLKELEK